MEQKNTAHRHQYFLQTTTRQQEYFFAAAVVATDLCPAVGEAVLGDGVVALCVPGQGVGGLLTTVGVARDFGTVGMTCKN